MSIKLRKTKSEIDSQQLAEVMERLQRMIRSAERAEGIGPLQWEVLRYLGRANRFSRFAIAAADYLSVTEGLVKKTLSELEERKYIQVSQTRIKSGANRSYDLTKAGEAMLRADPLAWIAADAAGIDTEGKALEALSIVLSHVLEDHRGREFGNCLGCKNYRASSEMGHSCRVFAIGLGKHELRQICWEYEVE